MELTVYKTSGEETAKKVVLEDTVFGVEPNDHAIYLDVKQYLANARQGTHKSKQRNEVAGSTRKLKRQKGTGGARSAASFRRSSPAEAAYSVPCRVTTASSSTRSSRGWPAAAHSLIR